MERRREPQVRRPCRYRAPRHRFGVGPATWCRGRGPSRCPPPGSRSRPSRTRAFPPRPAFVAPADAAGVIVVAHGRSRRTCPRLRPKLWGHRWPRSSSARVGPVSRSGSIYRFAGSERAYVAPSFTHFVSCRLVRTSSGSTRSHPFIRRPRISMRRALVVATSPSDCAGSTRTNTPPWPLAATAMLPPMRNARPPNIFFSIRPDSAPSSSRMRSASSSSYATAAIVHHGGRSEAPSPSAESPVDPLQIDPSSEGTRCAPRGQSCTEVDLVVAAKDVDALCRGAGWTRTSHERIVSLYLGRSPACPTRRKWL